MAGFVAEEVRDIAATVPIISDLLLYRGRARLTLVRREIQRRPPDGGPLPVHLLTFIFLR